MTGRANMDSIRLLVLYQGRTLETHPGYHDGFQRLQAEGVLADYRAIPYFGIALEHGWPALWEEAVRQIREYDINVVFIHFFHDNNTPDPSAGLKMMLACPSRPMLFTSLGDPFGIWLNRVPECYKIASGMSDINFMTGMGKIARRLAAQGTKNLVFMPNGVCHVRFSAPLERTGYAPEFDVVFIGSRMRSRWLVGSASWYGFWRDRLVAKLTRRFGNRFGLFGKGWEGQPCWQGFVNYDEQHLALRRAKIQIGGYPNCLNDYYTSDRVFIALASGIPLVDYAIPGIECLFENGRDWRLGRNFGEMLKHVESLLELPDEKRLDIGGRVRREILASHTQYHRCKQMIEIVQDYRNQKLAGKIPPPPALPFLRFPLSPASGKCAAIVNWKG